MGIDKLRIVYMGTPEFAVAPLQKLLDSGCSIVAVITAPDKPAGRGQKIRFPAVKEFALAKNLPLMQPRNLKDPAFVEELQRLAPDLQVVVAFRMLPEVVWRIPPKGTFNLHASLLPQYRGAAPINHAILNGESRTGVTTFMIDEKIDTGIILLQKETSIGEQENAGELHDRLMAMGAELVLETVLQLASNRLNPRPQDELISPGSNLKTAPRILKEDCRIDWKRPGREVFNLIRGLSPFPGAFTLLEGAGKSSILFKIFSSGFEPAVHNHSPGTCITDGKKYLKVAVPDGLLSIYQVQQEGRRKMSIVNFLSGTSLAYAQHRFS
jgi:methionyl-tRNA formyltransferase